MDQKQQNVLLIVVTVVLMIASWAMLWPPGERITKGLDIQGGLAVILTAQETSDTPVTTAVMDRAELIVINRVDGLGVKEATVQRQGNDSLLIQIPGISDPDAALKVLGETGRLEFVDVDSITDTATAAAVKANDQNVELKAGTYTPITVDGVPLTGAVVKTASVSQNPQTAEIEVNLSMSAEGGKAWGSYTTSSIGKQVAIVLDGVVKSAPVVRSAITDGQTAISGGFTAEEAKRLKTVLEAGALPVSLEPSESRVVGPTLGQNAFDQGVTAALVGLGLVSLYMLAFYRGLGLLTVGALVTFASFFLGILAFMSSLGVFALTLPGLAGIVLTIGLAADSSILILERFREEVRMGKTVRSAANSGSKHGIMTSIDADLVTLVSAASLYFVAIGPVKGFALTLMLGIFCDIIMMLLFKRPVLMLLAESVIPKNLSLWGVPSPDAVAPSAKGTKGGVAGA
ncbi:MAG: protein translocase subunit SecD [Coriobacteriia bacterium]|nr:protein translocase subunit SecD [Coriobacteriia bacterium]